MLEDIIVVQSAVSAFNNMALFGPAFLWLGLLMLPLFVVVYLMRDAILNKIAWEKTDVIKYGAMWTVGLTGAWVVLIGGDYQILRDSWSVLPMMCAVVLFLASLFLSSYGRKYKIPKMRWYWGVACVCGVVLVALSDMHAWWGPLLQVGAMFLGLALGRVAPAPMRPMAGTVLILLSTVVAILMQPEFFRFGQLGNLTLGHLVAILLVGISAIGAVVTNNVKPAGKIKHALYIKLKWLTRVICALGVALFLLTEAVPVLMAVLLMFFVMFAMSVRHSDRIQDGVAENIFAVMLMAFGVLTIVPVITVIGILLWRPELSRDVWYEVKRLL